MTPVKGIQPDELAEAWPLVEPLIRRGLKYADERYGADDVRRSIERLDRQLWVTWPEIDCALVTELVDYPRKRVLQVFIVAGRLPADWREIWRAVEGWAMSAGATGVELMGRRGWERRLPEFRASMTFLQKDLRP